MWVYIYQSWVEKEMQNAYIGEYIPWWDINNDTICYLRLRWNLTDETGNYTWTMATNGSFDTTVADIPVASLTYDNWYIVSTTNWPSLSWSNSYTISCWGMTSTGNIELFSYFNSPYMWIGLYKFKEWSTYKWYFAMYLWWYSGSSWFENYYAYNPWTTWHLYTVTYTPWSIKWYIDAVNVSSASATLSWTVTPWTTMEIWRHNHSTSFSPVWYYSDLLFEKKGKTQQEITDYYNLVKWNYWIS